MPEVSVVMPACNAGRTIDAAMASVLAQTFRGIEVIVVDDGSTDDTAARVAAYGAAITCEHQPHAGRSHAWNAALLAARGRFIAFMEPTNVWTPRKIEQQVQYFKAFPAAGLVYGDATSVHDVRLTSRQQCALVPPMPPGIANMRDIVTSSVMIRRELVDAIGRFDTSLPAEEAERDFLARGASRFPVGRINLPIVITRADAEPAFAPALATAAHRNLLHDTGFRRTRSMLAKAFHGVDETITRHLRRRQRILFEAASPMSLAVFAPVLRHMKDDPRLEFWFTSCDRSWTPQAIFGPAHLTGRVVSPDTVRWMKFDGYINTDFWDMTWLPRGTKRVHFFHGVAGKYGLDAPVRIAPVVATFDRLLFPNRDRLRRYAEAGLVDADSARAALIGYPKVDCLVDGSLNRSETLARAGADASRPTVLYAPTWSPYSSLNSVGHQLIAALGHLDVNIIVKLHDRSYDSTARGSGGVDWRRRLRHVCERHGAHLVHDADASPWLHAADLLITDHSSVGFEFMLLDRPVVVLDSPDLLAHARVNPDKVTMLRGAAHVVRQIGELGATVAAALANPAEHHVQRTRVADALFYCPGSATARAVQCIYNLLELPQPAALGVEAHEEPATRKLRSLARTV
jgi:glycosyltransferase involved in cell wall biosynthesis